MFFLKQTKKPRIFSYFPLDKEYLKRYFLVESSGNMGIFTSQLPWWLLGAVSVHKRGKSRAVFLNPLLQVFPFSLLKKRVIRHEQIHLHRQSILGSAFFEENLVRYLMFFSKPFPRILMNFCVFFVLMSFCGFLIFVEKGFLFYLLSITFFLVLLYGGYFLKLHKVMTKLKACMHNPDRVFALMLRLKEEEVELFSSLSCHQLSRLVDNWSHSLPRWCLLNSLFLFKKPSLTRIT